MSIVFILFSYFIIWQLVRYLAFDLHTVIDTVLQIKVLTYLSINCIEVHRSTLLGLCAYEPFILWFDLFFLLEMDLSMIRYSTVKLISYMNPFFLLIMKSIIRFHIRDVF